MNVRTKSYSLDPLGWMAVFACSALAVGLVPSVGAQARRSRTVASTGGQVRGVKPDRAAVENDAGIRTEELGDTVAIVPWNYKNSRDAAVQSAHEVCSQLLLGTGFNVFLIKTAAGAMPPPMSGISGSKKQESAFAHLLGAGRNVVTQDAPKKANAVYVLPTLDEMTALGEKLNTRYVLAGRAQWRSRNVWIGVSNRIKSICSVDIMILDMNTRHLVLDAHNVEGDSTENKNLYNAFTNLMALNPMPLVMPGSVGPYEQRAVTAAIARAMHPWLKTERIRAALAQADASSEIGLDRKPTGRFSALLSSLSDVTTSDGKPPDMGDKELTRLFALHEVTLQYKEPNRFRLMATSPKDGKETLVVNEEQRSFTVGEGKKATHQDFSSTPTRRSFLFESFGILTRGSFDTIRARFVKEETLDRVSTVVYDLTYWGQDDGAYHRVWIDPSRRLIVKRERFDADSKLKSIVLYKQPTEVSPNLWIPGLVELQDSAHKNIATLKITKPQVNQAILDSEFTVVTP
jgi:outer membrane lipoprotein-sorting protein